jgi:endoglucanase
MRTLLVSFYLLAFTTFLNAQPVKTHGRLHVEGTQLTDEVGREVVLRGMSFGWHNFWPRFYNSGAVKWLHEDWNVSVIRAAMGVEPKNGYIDNPKESKAKIEAVINAAIAEGVYVIIDWHSHHIRLEEAKIFFKEMATKYGKYPNIIYEVFNEPEKDSWADVKAYSTELIATIRFVDTNNVILVGSPHWDQDIHLAADDPINGYKNLMYTLHYYAGTHKQSLRDRGDYALAKGLPLFISESAGMEATGDGKIDVAEWKKWIEWSEKNKISWITWSVSDKNETCSVLQSGAASEGGWTDHDLKESGKMAREFLRKFASKEQH